MDEFVTKAGWRVRGEAAEKHGEKAKLHKKLEEVEFKLAKVEKLIQAHPNNPKYRLTHTWFIRVRNRLRKALGLPIEGKA